jgi:hypothetical protein
MLGTLWRTYGPMMIAGGTALLQRQGYPPAGGSGDASRGYDLDGDGPEPVLMPSQSRTSSAGSASGLRDRIGSSANIGPDGRFVEVEVPSDAESERASGGLPAPAPRHSSGSWFGWATGATAPAHEKAD